MYIFMAIVAFRLHTAPIIKSPINKYKCNQSCILEREREFVKNDTHNGGFRVSPVGAPSPYTYLVQYFDRVHVL